MDIAVINFDNSGFSREIIHRLTILGINTTLIQEKEWTLSRTCHDLSILAFGKPSLKAINQIEIKISEKQHEPFLGAFHPEYDYCDDELPNLLNDCFTSPCSLSELLFRLKKQSLNSIPADILLENKQNKTDKRYKPLLPEMIGQSKRFTETSNFLRRIADIDAPVLIEGESGTGKELAARALHYNSSRKNKPFISVNCGALPKDLVENELFGHRKGAYTGAEGACQGLISQAEEGTLFLDEISNIDIRSQGVLLRFLQNHEYSRLGSGNIRKANIRLLCASNVPLEEKVEDKSFRLDLFYRINVLNVVLPPLRKRDEDIALLANYFLKKYQQKYAGIEREFSYEYLEWLKQHDWPGNIRELDNMVHRDYLIADHHFIHPSKQCRKNTNSQSNNHLIEKYSEAKAQVIVQFEISYLKQIMKKTKGNISKAASLAAKDRADFGKLLKKHGIERRNFL